MKRLYPSIWKKGTSSDPVTILVEDIMPGMFKFSGATFQPIDFYKAFMRQTLSFFTASSRGILKVLRADISEFVPPEKRQLQIKRSAAWTSLINKRTGKPNVPYPDGCTVSDAGIVSADKKEVYPLEVDRLMFTRYLRKLFFEYLEEKIAGDPVWPEDTTIIFDWRITGPRVFRKLSEHEQSNSKSGMGWVPMDAKWNNRYGEADLGVVWWLEKIFLDYPNESVELRTVDTDSLPIMVSRFWNRLNHKVYWVHSPTEYICFHELIAALQKPVAIEPRIKIRGQTPKAMVRWSPDLFVAGCVVSGCDYYDKKDSSNFVGHSTMWDAFMRCLPLIKDPLDTLSGYCQLVRCIWGYHYDAYLMEAKEAPSYDYIQSACSARKSKRTKPPKSDDDLKASFLRYRFTFLYWTTLDNQHLSTMPKEDVKLAPIFTQVREDVYTEAETQAMDVVDSKQQIEEEDDIQDMAGYRPPPPPPPAAIDDDDVKPMFLLNAKSCKQCLNPAGYDYHIKPTFGFGSDLDGKHVDEWAAHTMRYKEAWRHMANHLDPTLSDRQQQEHKSKWQTQYHLTLCCPKRHHNPLLGLCPS